MPDYTNAPSIVHTLTLSDNEAYHLFALAYLRETGPAFPYGLTAGGIDRITSWFDRDTYTRFRKELHAGRVVEGASRAPNPDEDAHTEDDE